MRKVRRVRFVSRHLEKTVYKDYIKTAGKRFLDTFVKPFLIIINCLIGFIFEFLIELPFLVILGFHYLFSKKQPTE